MVWLPDIEKSLMMCLAVLTQYRSVMDRQTDKPDMLRQRSQCYA